MGMEHARTTQASHEYPSTDFRMRKEIARIGKENRVLGTGDGWPSSSSLLIMLMSGH